jgi:hypothetical protein
MLTIEEFCTARQACREGREWALANCTDMQDVWNKLQPEWLIWVALRRGVLSEKELRLFAVHCVRSLEQFLTDPRINECVNVAEKFANGEASVTDLELVREAAATTFKTFNLYSNPPGVWTRAANRLAYRLAQAKWLRENTKPNFEA